jgi:hypothetical protein
MDRQAMDSLLVLTSIRTCYCKLLMSQQMAPDKFGHGSLKFWKREMSFCSKGEVERFRLAWLQWPQRGDFPSVQRSMQELLLSTQVPDIFSE